MARWSISPCSISRSAEKPSIGTCLTSRMWPLLLALRAYCMTRSWGYPPQKRPDPGRYEPLRYGAITPLKPAPASCRNREWEQRDARDRSPLLDAADHLAKPPPAV